MRKVYLSFLGLGSYDKATDSNFYLRTVYELNGRHSAETEFVQAAEMELLGADQFDLVLIVATQKSHDAHYQSKLEPQLREKGADPRVLIIEEEMEPRHQWQWFEQILCHIEYGDQLTVDLTHGYRSVPIIFSTAINFLQKARNIGIEAVYYGAFDRNRELAPIIDMKDFYLINEWADAVSRLVDDADARKMAEVAERSPEFQVGELNDPEVIRIFEDLTDTIRNVDVNNVAKKANAAIRHIREKEKSASEIGKLLLKLVIDKFVILTTDLPPSGKYDRDYFRVQIEIIRLLLEHKLYMQAYTVMREFIASVGMIPFEQEGMKSKKRKKRRTRYAEVFVNMCRYERTEWDFPGREEAMARLLPFYENLESIGLVQELHQFTRELIDYRNGFDHAWTAKPGAAEDISEKGAIFLQHLENVLLQLERHGQLNY